MTASVPISGARIKRNQAGSITCIPVRQKRFDVHAKDRGMKWIIDPGPFKKIFDLQLSLLYRTGILCLPNKKYKRKKINSPYRPT